MSNSYSKKKYAPSMIGKIIGIILCSFVLILLFAGTKALVTHRFEREYLNDRSNQMKSCDRSYHDRKFAALYQTMDLYVLRGGDYDVYDEILEAQMDYIDYCSFTGLARQGVEGAEERVEELRQKILQNAKNCRNSSNKKLLEEYCGKIGY